MGRTNRSIALLLGLFIIFITAKETKADNDPTNTYVSVAEQEAINRQNPENQKRQDELYAQYCKMKNDAIALRSSGDNLNAYKKYIEFLKKVDTLQYQRGLTQQLTQDTIGVRDSMLECLKATKQYKAFMSNKDKINELNDLIIKLSRKYGILIIGGKVQDVDKNTISVWGKAIPVAAAWEKSKTSDYTDAALVTGSEGVPGAVLEESNILLSPYNSITKIDGYAVIGNKIGVMGYCYKNKTTGTNVYGGTVQMRVYQPCPCNKIFLSALADQNTLIDNNKVFCQEMGLDNNGRIEY